MKFTPWQSKCGRLFALWTQHSRVPNEHWSIHTITAQGNHHLMRTWYSQSGYIRPDYFLTEVILFSPSGIFRACPLTSLDLISQTNCQVSAVKYLGLCYAPAHGIQSRGDELGQMDTWVSQKVLAEPTPIFEGKVVLVNNMHGTVLRVEL